MRPRKVSFSELITKNKNDILRDEDVLDKIELEVEARQLNMKYDEKPQQPKDKVYL